MEPARVVHRRIWREGSPSSGRRSIPEETAVALTYNGGTYAVMMTTPQDLEEVEFWRRVVALVHLPELVGLGVARLEEVGIELADQRDMTAALPAPDGAARDAADPGGKCFRRSR